MLYSACCVLYAVLCILCTVLCALYSVKLTLHEILGTEMGHCGPHLYYISQDTECKSSVKGMNTTAPAWVYSSGGRKCDCNSL